MTRYWQRRIMVEDGAWWGYWRRFRVVRVWFDNITTMMCLGVTQSVSLIIASYLIGT